MAYTKGEIDKLLENLTIVIDTREQENLHIIKYLDKKGIKYIKEKLDQGDYSCFLGNLDFRNKIAIERKAHLEELSGNLTKGRDRFERELQRAKDLNMDFYLLVENGSLFNIWKHDYNTDFNPKSFYNTLSAYQQQERFNLKAEMIGNNQFLWIKYYHKEKNPQKKAEILKKINKARRENLEASAEFIYNKLYIYVKKYLEGVG